VVLLGVEGEFDVVGYIAHNCYLRNDYTSSFVEFEKLGIIFKEADC